uniref:Uncharacterized protein n=1 Tax=Cucumis melo TaxID=3656 RepID=A0A9I9EF43_CUCME
MSASIVVAEAVWKRIESTRLACISCLERTSSELLELLIKEGSRKFQATQADGLSFSLSTSKLEDSLEDEFGFLTMLGCGRISKERGCKHQLAARLAASVGACIEVKFNLSNFVVLRNEYLLRCNVAWLIRDGEGHFIAPFVKYLIIMIQETMSITSVV